MRNDFSPRFYLRHLKDVRLIEDLARRLAVPLPATARITPLYQAAENEGLGEFNGSGIHKFLFSMCCGLESSPELRSTSQQAAVRDSQSLRSGKVRSWRGLVTAFKACRILRPASPRG